MSENIQIKFRIEKDNPLDITTLATALLSFNNSIDEFVATQTGVSGARTTLQSVEKGSDIFNMVIFAASGVLAIGEFLPTINAYFEFFGNIKNMGKKSVDDIIQDPLLTPTSLQNLENVVKLADKDRVSVEITSPVFNHCIFINQDNKEAYKQGIATARQIKDFENKEQKYFENVLIRMKEVKDSDRIVKDKAVCDDILPGRAVSAEIVDKEAKELINKNPFDNYYLVDLTVHKMSGAVKLYRITALHSIIPKGKAKDDQ